MRVAALYDIHGNAPALEAVLAGVAREAVDLVVVGGDVVPGPMPRECLDLLVGLDVPVRYIRGNGEREVLTVRDGGAPSPLAASVVEAIRWVAGALSDDDVARMRGWPATARVALEDGTEALFCHATPRSDSEIFTRLTPDDVLLPVFAGVDADLVVCGHTHMQVDRRVGDVRVVNAGSVGMPFGEPGAFWLLLSPGVEPRRTEYDRDAAAARIRATDYPGAPRFADVDVLSPMTEDDALAAMEGAALGRGGPAGADG